jgi:hypothetical protein
MSSRAEDTAGQRSLPGLVRTLVVSDLHLGARTGVDVLRRPAARGALLARVEGVDRLVLLGDTLELRHGPLREALAAARPVVDALGTALGAEGEVVLVAGNHDHRLVAPWLEARGQAGPPPALGLEEHAGAGATAATAEIARMVAPARLDVAYPGLWLADGVYATHGHYLDRHVTIPSFERLAAGALGRVLGDHVDDISCPDDYEVVLAPLYALLDAIAARAPDGRGPSHANASTRAWRALTDGGRVRRTLLAGAFPLGIGALNRVGVGPVRADLSGAELRRAGLRAMRAVIAALGIDGRHVVFGHTHRAGPLAADEPADWALPGGGRLINAGSWVLDRAWTRAGPGGPYWPGGAVEIGDDGVARHVRLLDETPEAELLA